MNILVLSSKSPYPLKDGHSLRTFNLLKQVSLKNNIFFLTYFANKEEEDSFFEIKKICKMAQGFKLPVANSRFLLILALVKNLFSTLPFVCEKYCTKEMSEKIKEILIEGKIELVHVDILPLMNYYSIIKEYPIVLNTHNIESLLLKRRVSFTTNLVERCYLWLQYIKLYSFEKKQFLLADCCTTVSQQDKEFLQKMSRNSPVHIVPNGVDIDYFSPDGKDDEMNALIYVGGFNWFPNLDGMNYFCEKILPKIIEKVKYVETFVVGKENRKFQYADKIKPVGCVEDTRPYINKAKVFIVPLRVGGGTRLKILNAMALGKAIVSTSIGCEGLDVQNRINIIIEDEPERFAEAVVELLNNDKKRRFLGVNARKLVEEKYNWEKIGEKMNEIYSKLGK
jgi:glycosyltransferase involved in cell wall biosynthesis